MMSDTAARNRAVSALTELIGAPAGATFEQLLPRTRWLERRSWLADVAAEVERQPKRRQLRDALAAAIGDEHADTLMAYLAPLPEDLRSAGRRTAARSLGQQARHSDVQ